MKHVHTNSYVYLHKKYYILIITQPDTSCFSNNMWIYLYIYANAVLPFLSTFLGSVTNMQHVASKHMHSVAQQRIHEPTPRDHMQLEPCTGWSRHSAELTPRAPTLFVLITHTHAHTHTHIHTYIYTYKQILYLVRGWIIAL